MRDLYIFVFSKFGAPRLYNRLERLSHCDIEWNKVTVTLVDERWVPEEHPDSNAGLVKSRLLKGRAGHARFVGLKTAEPASGSIAWLARARMSVAKNWSRTIRAR